MEVSEIIEQVDIVEYIGQYCELEQKQDGEYWGLSPLKDENTPSFSVSAELQRFYDFSSGKGGNILDFIRVYHNCDFYRGLTLLKQYAKIDDHEETGEVRRLAAASVARKFKPKSNPSKTPNSTILPPDYMERYERREDKLQAWIAEGVSQTSLDQFGVRYDPFSDRIVYPIYDNEGNMVNVGGRTLDPDYKEKGLRKYTYFKPWGGAMSVIYGLWENREAIREKREIILFEGAKSVLLANTWGIQNTGAILTSHLSPFQFRLLIRLGVRIVFALDAEVDIRQDVNIKKLLPYAQVEWVKNFGNLLDPKDSPVDRGREVFEKLYQERVRIA